MKDETKEILEHLSATQKINNGWTSFSVEECKGLYDYITNLQTIEREYSAILSENAELENKINNLQEEKDKYKLRCYKAKKMIFDNYGVLDKYEIEMLEDILDGKSDE